MKNMHKNTKQTLFVAIFALVSPVFPADKNISLSVNGNQNPEMLAKDGDIVLQTVSSPQGDLITANFGVRLNNVGLIRKINGKPFVLSVVDSVGIYSFYSWKRMGVKSQFVILRLKKSQEILTDSSIKKMNDIEDAFLGRPFDFSLSWNSDSIYPSELIWKTFKEGANHELNKLLSQHDLDSTFATMETLRTIRRPPQSGEKYADLGRLLFDTSLYMVYSNIKFKYHELQ